MSWFRKSTQPEGAATPDTEDRLAAVGPGVPGRCPSCDGLGYIDTIDLGHRFQIQHCKDCGHRWEYLFDAEGRVVGLTELDEHGQPRSRTRVRPRPAPAGPAVPGPATGVEPEPAPPVEPPAAEGEADEVTEVIDLRDPVAEPTPAPTDGAVPEEMSPAEWLRHALRR
ncbi:MAG TPA: hypothetical protein VFV42_12960 [Acidimicrobiales bacterium]|nr:hypothetical protein [Acidimicrobiales bacterium]